MGNAGGSAKAGRAAGGSRRVGPVRAGSGYGLPMAGERVSWSLEQGHEARLPRVIVIIFEVYPAAGRLDEYLETAAALRLDLERMPGFISVERFQSLTDPTKYLSLSTWEDEAAVTRWRNHTVHREAQAAGRGGVFADYRLRVVCVLRDYGMRARREQAPADAPFRT